MTHHDGDEPPPLYAVPPPGDDRERAQPVDHQAERATLGAMLLTPTAVETVGDILYGTEFDQPAHELVYQAILAVHLEGHQADMVTVCAYLEETGNLRRAGGAPYLHTLANSVPTPENAAHYAGIVADRAARRRLITAGTRIRELGYATGNDITTSVDAATTELAKATTEHTTSTDSSWTPVNLAEIRTSDHQRPQASRLINTAGKGLLYPGAVHSISGEPTSGKSWVALTGAAQEIAAGHPVLYVDFEDRPETLIARLDDLGCNPTAVDRLVRYIRPEQAMTPTLARHLDQAATGCRIAIIDGVTEAMTMHDLDLSANIDVAQWLALLPRRIANMGCAVLQIDHVVKDVEARGRYAIGGQHKLAGIVASYTMLVAKPFAPGKAGHARIVVAKDRHGDVGTVGETAAELHMAPDTDRSATAVKWALTASTVTTTDGSGPRFTGYMEKVSRLVEITPGINQGEILKAIRGKATYINQAIQSLVEEDFIRVEKGGPGAATRHYSAAPFREDFP